MGEEDEHHPPGFVFKSQTPAITVMAQIQAEECFVQEATSSVPPEMQ